MWSAFGRLRAFLLPARLPACRPARLQTHGACPTARSSACLIACLPLSLALPS